MVLLLWMTDVFHLRWCGVEISAPFAALLGAVIVLFPRWGVLQWSEAVFPGLIGLAVLSLAYAAIAF